MKPWIIGEILLGCSVIIALTIGFAGVPFWWTGFVLTWPLLIIGGLLQIYQYRLDKKKSNESQGIEKP